MNTFKTALFLGVLTAILVFTGGAIGGRGGMTAAFLFACLMNFGAYWFSDKIVLAMYRATPLSESEAPRVFQIIRRLASKAGMPMPKVYRLPVSTPNAFATGRSPNHSAVAVTDGILELLDEEELTGVLAHELSHVLNRDILIATVAASIAGSVSMLASMARWAFLLGGRPGNRGKHPLSVFAAALVAPIAAALIQLAVSRSREYEADRRGARLVGNPLPLAGALRKLESAQTQSPMQDVNPSTAHLFIVNPLRGGKILNLFSTHPPLEDRIKRLEEMAR